MHTIELRNNEFYSFASCLEELSPKAYLKLLKLVLLEKNGLISFNDFILQLTMQLLDIRKTVRYILMSAEKREQIHANILSLSRELDSFFILENQDGKEVKVFRLDTNKNLLPVFGGLYGPADALTDLSFFEYKTAYNCFAEFGTTKDAEKLNQLIAILYRPTRKFHFIRKHMAGYNGQKRIRLSPKSNPFHFELQVKIVSRWPEHVKLGIYLWFSGCMEYLKSGCPLIDGNEMNLAVLYSGGSEGPAGIGLSGILFTLSESKVFGNLEETSNSNLYDVLARLYQLKVDYDYQLKKMK